MLICRIKTDQTNLLETLSFQPTMQFKCVQKESLKSMKNGCIQYWFCWFGNYGELAFCLNQIKTNIVIYIYACVYMGVSILYPLSGSYINRPREQTTVTFCKYRLFFVWDLCAHIRFFRACLQRDEGRVEGIHLPAPPHPIPTARQLRPRGPTASS